MMVNDVVIEGVWDSYKFYDTPDKSDPLNQLRLLVLKRGGTYHRIVFTVIADADAVGVEWPTLPPKHNL